MFHSKLLSTATMHRIEFTKVSGAGNDFVLIDDRLDSLPTNKPLLAQTLCSRVFGIGADGLLVLQKSNHVDFKMSYYNADGSFGGMCGNGGRCIARYAYLKGVAGPRMTFEALDFNYMAEINGENVRLWMKQPKNFKENIQIKTELGVFAAYFIDNGSPHVIIFVEDVSTINVHDIGRAIRENNLFSPAGTNVNFVQVIGPNSISIRTYERGVEDETLACGTGSVAAALVSVLSGRVKHPVQVGVRSGEKLQVNFELRGESAHNVSLEGSAHMLFQGSAVYDSAKGKICRISTEIKPPQART
ncbi:MAG: diaminopimelate epimerase [Bacteroidota bacterium]